MNLLQAIEQKKIQPGDSFLFKNNNETFTMDESGRFIHSELGNALVFNFEDFHREDFEIIKAEMEVKKAFSKDYAKHSYPTVEFRWCIKKERRVLQQKYSGEETYWKDVPIVEEPKP